MKRPVFGSTRASACSCGTESARWISSSGAIANGTSQGLPVQNAARMTPRAAKTNSVESVWYEKSCRIGWPWTRRIMGAISAELSTTRTTAAAVPASAKRMSSEAIRSSAPEMTCAAPHADIVAIVNTKMFVDLHVPRPAAAQPLGNVLDQRDQGEQRRLYEQCRRDQEDAGRVVALVAGRAHDEELRHRNTRRESDELEPIARVAVEIGEERHRHGERGSADEQKVGKRLRAGAWRCARGCSRARPLPRGGLRSLWSACALHAACLLRCRRESKAAQPTDLAGSEGMPGLGVRHPPIEARTRQIHPKG